MSKLATYDKNVCASDERKLGNFRHDFIYKKNARVRFWVLVGFLLFAALFFAKLMVIDGKTLDEFLVGGEYKAYLTKFATWLLIAEAAYTAVGTLIFTISYQKARKRADDYFETLGKLERRRTKLAAKARQIKALRDDDPFFEEADDVFFKDDGFWDDVPETTPIKKEETTDENGEASSDGDFDDDLDAPPPPYSMPVYTPKAPPTKPRSERRGITKNNQYSIGK